MSFMVHIIFCLLINWRLQYRITEYCHPEYRAIEVLEARS